MIVRISGGGGQFELDDQAAHQLEGMDQALTSALHAGQEEEFHRVLQSLITYVCEHGKEVSHDTVVPSDLIIPPEDMTMEEAGRMLTDEGFLHPVPA